MDANFLLAITIGMALVFGFLNGFQDSANVVATMISSRVMNPRGALTIAAVSVFTGSLIFGTAVAEAIGNEIAPAQTLSVRVVVAALASATLWILITWWFGIPSSSSHALVGGIIGAVSLGSGIGVLRPEGIAKIALTLFLSPVIGIVLGVSLMRLVLWMVRGAPPSINPFFKFGQVPTAIALALSHGANSAQKTMGIITMGLVTLGFQGQFQVPTWVIFASAGAMALGTALGAWRIIRTLGGKFYRIRAVHSFVSQLTSGIIIFGASILGGPVSTTQVVSSSIIGAGAAQRMSQVRWGVMVDILAAWFLTIPATACLSAIIYLAIGMLAP